MALSLDGFGALFADSFQGPLQGTVRGSSLGFRVFWVTVPGLFRVQGFGLRVLGIRASGVNGVSGLT